MVVHEYFGIGPELIIDIPTTSFVPAPKHCASGRTDEGRLAPRGGGAGSIRCLRLSKTHLNGPWTTQTDQVPSDQGQVGDSARRWAVTR